jgi:hypothetical protein
MKDIRIEKKEKIKTIMLSLCVCVCVLGFFFLKEAQANDCEKICRYYTKVENNSCLQKCFKVVRSTMLDFTKKCNEICKAESGTEPKESRELKFEACQITCEDIATGLFRFAE